MRSSVPMTALPGRSQSSHDRLAKALGWFSLALGAAELLAPDVICRASGLEDRRALIRGYGGREIATGIAILASHDATPWIWGRVLGDAVDIATAATALRDPDRSGKAGIALATLAAVAALDVYVAAGLSAEKGGRKTATADYRDRSGFPQGVEAARGAAREPRGRGDAEGLLFESETTELVIAGREDAEAALASGS